MATYSRKREQKCGAKSDCLFVAPGVGADSVLYLNVIDMPNSRLYKCDLTGSAQHQAHTAVKSVACGQSKGRMLGWARQSNHASCNSLQSILHDPSQQLESRCDGNIALETTDRPNFVERPSHSNLWLCCAHQQCVLTAMGWYRWWSCCWYEVRTQHPVFTWNREESGHFVVGLAYVIFSLAAIHKEHLNWYWNFTYRVASDQWVQEAVLGDWAKDLAWLECKYC